MFSQSLSIRCHSMHASHICPWLSFTRLPVYLLAAAAEDVRVATEVRAAMEVRSSRDGFHIHSTSFHGWVTIVIIN